MNLAYEILYIDGPIDDGLTILNYESFLYGLEISTVNKQDYNITKFNVKYNIIDTKNTVLNFIDNTPNIQTLIDEDKFFILVIASNQLFGAIDALNERNNDHNEKVLIISSSGLGTLPNGQNISLLYSGNKEVESIIIHQNIHNIKYAIMIYEKNNIYCEDYKNIYQNKNLLCNVDYISLELNNIDDSVETLNKLLHKIYNKNPKKMYEYEIILNIFTNQTNYIVPKNKYYEGLRVVCGVASDNAEPINYNIKMPVMITKVIPLDITEATNIYRDYMLKFDKVPSSFAAAYYDAAIQLGQMIILKNKINVVNFCNKITLYVDNQSVQYAGAWINKNKKRNTNANYGYIYTFDPIMNNKHKIHNYYKRSPWMPILPNSASMPYNIANVFWVELKKWVIYYSCWRYFPNIKNSPKYLKYYLGIDKSDYIKNKCNYEFTVTGYASKHLPIYFIKKNNIEYPIFDIPDKDKKIFIYPFDYIKKIKI